MIGIFDSGFGGLTGDGQEFVPAQPFAQAGAGQDAQGAVLPGVTVTATSPALLGKEVAVSEANGDYRFPNLPAGTYARLKLRFLNVAIATEFAARRAVAGNLKPTGLAALTKAIDGGTLTIDWQLKR